ncbi:MAG: hypothetical protein LLG01_14565 [Planctomycetaceae bacterium]|nr:hypothetical protein [Planctomycetaceae bacterium]
MRRLVTVALLAAIVATLTVNMAHSEPPKPSEAQFKWQFDFRYDPPRPIQVTLPGEKTKRTFWYVIFTVTNRTGVDRSYVPAFELYTDTGQLMAAGRNTPTFVFNKIKELHNLPLLVTMTSLIDKTLLQGEDNARHSVAVWQDIDPAAGGFDIFVGGLSGETAVVKLPQPVKTMQYDSRGQAKEVMTDQLLLTKQLQLTYKLPGEASARVYNPAVFAGKQWVMR